MLLITCLLALMSCALAEDLHTTLDDYHDIDAVIANPDMLRSFTLCFVQKGPCNDLTESFRKNMPVAVPEACKRCTDGQKHMFRTYLNGLESVAPDLYKIYTDYYDPEGKYMAALRSAIAGY